MANTAGQWHALNPLLWPTPQAQLEDQQRHLNIGLEKIRTTEVQVAELQVKLQVKDTELAAKNVEANEKLKQMLEDKNTAERKKESAEASGTL